MRASVVRACALLMVWLTLSANAADQHFLSKKGERLSGGEKTVSDKDEGNIGNGREGKEKDDADGAAGFEAENSEPNVGDMEKKLEDSDDALGVLVAKSSVDLDAMDVAINNTANVTEADLDAMEGLSVNDTAELGSANLGEAAKKPSNMTGGPSPGDANASEAASQPHNATHVDVGAEVAAENATDFASAGGVDGHNATLELQSTSIPAAGQPEQSAEQSAYPDTEHLSTAASVVRAPKAVHPPTSPSGAKYPLLLCLPLGILAAVAVWRLGRCGDSGSDFHKLDADARTPRRFGRSRSGGRSRDGYQIHGVA